MVFNNLCILVLWTKVASALEGLTLKDYNFLKRELKCFNLCASAVCTWSDNLEIMEYLNYRFYLKDI